MSLVSQADSMNPRRFIGLLLAGTVLVAGLVWWMGGNRTQPVRPVDQPMPKLKLDRGMGGNQDVRIPAAVTLNLSRSSPGGRLEDRLARLDPSGMIKNRGIQPGVSPMGSDIYGLTLYSSWLNTSGGSPDVGMRIHQDPVSGNFEVSGSEVMYSGWGLFLDRDRELNDTRGGFQFRRSF